MLDATRVDAVKTMKFMGVLRIATGTLLAEIATHADSLNTWSLVQHQTNTVVSCVAFGPNGFIAGGADDSGGLILQSDDGVVWNQLAASTSDVWQAVVYARGAYVMVGSQGAILRSTNGTVWTEVRPQGEVNLQALTFGNGLFIASGFGTGLAGSIALLLISPDGITWA